MRRPSAERERRACLRPRPAWCEASDLYTVQYCALRGNRSRARKGDCVKVVARLPPGFRRLRTIARLQPSTSYRRPLHDNIRPINDVSSLDSKNTFRLCSMREVDTVGYLIYQPPRLCLSPPACLHRRSASCLCLHSWSGETSLHSFLEGVAGCG